MVSFADHWIGYTAFAVFLAAYILVIVEESLHLRKSKPVMVAAGVIWMLTAIAYASQHQSHLVAEILRHNLLEYAELMLFLLSAMTFINTMAERNIFSGLRTGLVSLGLSLRAVFWLTGILAFFISPVADNLTTALVMGAVVMAMGAGNGRFISVACINVVVAANAGGAFSPFGDITTLMVWQKGVVRFGDFLSLFIPSLINWLVPAALMSLTIPYEKPSSRTESVRVKHGGYVVVMLFLFTIAGTVLLHHVLEIPPFLGMMTGLGALKSYGYFLRRKELNEWVEVPAFDGSVSMGVEFKPAAKPFDVFISMKRVEWDTLMFFYGIMLCVGGLGALGYLAALSDVLYKDLGATTANILVGILSAVVDNIPVMFAVLSMNPDMSLGQWLLVTLTAGVGGSLLSIGSAAGVALMGQARGIYTFSAHLKWIWAIALGYAASIAVHFAMNGALFGS
ncbi:MAG: sodium:proton antiporter NhaD [Nitrospiraceae bacterium]|jgi:Na+/H+ antiporter NhaD/arsenite permease-like protein|uniref:sodium:proton antiporter NhaD n=1 Tax=Nitrospira cf. moscoviensis SBR1015 TaxID=96242 RepID=UPI000A0A6225|nr:sodium:proton antiporter NhaD [Nitrospira cf. moscoviensis SBR1015]MBX9658149.1 sodium:proton antiporter NhaD [Nitrospiraceae bacterium]OQW29992.1 MAG: sodium:proton antiporter [Nitrospira sp. SG-bin2]